MPNLPLEDIEAAVKTIFKTWADGLANHKRCLLWPLGALWPRMRKRRMFWSEIAKTAIVVPRRRAVIFRLNDRGKLILALSKAPIGTDGNSS